MYLIKTWMYRRNLYSVEPYEDMTDEMDILIDQSFTPDDSESMQLFSPILASPVVIDNTSNQYTLRVYFSGVSSPSNNLRFYGARIEYTLQTLQP